MSRHEEYLRRNLCHASALGIDANLRAAIYRLERQKRAPKWLMALLAGALKRAAEVHPEMAKWRNSAPDAPEHMRTDGAAANK